MCVLSKKVCEKYLFEFCIVSANQTFVLINNTVLGESELNQCA